MQLLLRRPVDAAFVHLEGGGLAVRLAERAGVFAECGGALRVDDEVPGAARLPSLRRVVLGILLNIVLIDVEGGGVHLERKERAGVKVDARAGAKL